MRFVHATIPAGKQGAALEILDGEDIEYTVNVETSDQDHVAVVSFPLPQSAVEQILDRLREIGIDDTGSIVVLDAKTVWFLSASNNCERATRSGGSISVESPAKSFARRPKRSRPRSRNDGRIW